MNISNKDKRRFENDMAALFRLKELVKEQQALLDFDLFERFQREIMTPVKRPVYLSKTAYEGLLRIKELMVAFLPSREFIEEEDIEHACRTVLGRLYIEESPSKDIDSFFRSVEETVGPLIKTRKFYSSLDGIDIVDFEELNIGTFAIAKPDIQALQSFDINENTAQKLLGNMQHGLWITGEVKGSPAHAERIFFERVRATCGVLAISLTTVLKRGAAAVQLIPSMEGRMRPNSVSWFSFELDSMGLSRSFSFRHPSIEINKHNYDELCTCEWFNELVRISQSDVSTEVESAIQRSIYWFFDAQADTIPEMQFVKFWSCIECFFSFEKEKTTAAIIEGLSLLLTGGSYGFIQAEFYSKLKKEIEGLYDKRSLAVHNAEHDHITSTDVSTVSKWAAWVILEYATLVARGFETRAAAKIQIYEMNIRAASTN